MEPQDEAGSSQVPPRRAVTVSRTRSGVLTALRTRTMYPNIEDVSEAIAWQVQDLATNRVTYLVDSFIRRGLRGNKRTTVAASGRFIYVVYDSNITHIVCDPQQRFFRRIQAPPAPGPSHSIVAMVVDDGNQRYRIVQLAEVVFSPHSASRGRLIEVSLYDSRGGGWTRLCSAAPAVACAPLSGVILDGVLYTMFELFAPGRPFELHSCDLDTGAWRRIDVPLPHLARQSTKTRPQLVAAAGRLFFVGYHPPPRAEAFISLSIWQIPLQSENQTPTLVTHLMWVLDGRNEREYWATAPPVQAVGCGDSIVVSNFLGRRWRWDVVQGTWQGMESFSPVQPLIAGHSIVVAPFEIQRQAR